MFDLTRRVHEEYVRARHPLVPHGSIHMVPTAEVAAYRKLARHRGNALAPGKVRNQSAEDRAAGAQKWDELIMSMRDHGFDPNCPVQFRITRDPKLKLHQGHHRVGVALELGINEIPVQFWFDGS